MYNDIMDAVTRKLDALFPEITVYTSGVEQGLIEPCFFVGFLEPSEKPLLGHRYFRSTGMSIQYLPGEVEQPARELNRVLEILMDSMEYLSLASGSLMRGSQRSGEPRDGVLTFFVNYNRFGMRTGKMEDSMENIKVK
nr:MAG TPA: tail completion protein [Caudoviricetes sp.]